MTVCPIAVVVGCAKCPAFKVCPLKGVLGDQKPTQAADEPAAKPKGASKPAAKRSGTSRR